MTIISLIISIFSIMFAVLSLLLAKTVYASPSEQIVQNNSTELISNPDFKDKGFVLNDIYYSYDGKTIHPSDEHQNTVVLNFTGVDVTGWEVTIGIPNGPFSVRLVENYSENVELKVSDGNYSIQVFDQNDEKLRVYTSIVDINDDGEYAIDLSNARLYEHEL